MNLQQLAQFADLIGALTIVVSLVYVARQVRQNTLTLRAENYGRALDRVAALQSRLSDDAELVRLFGQGLVDPLQLPRTERLRFIWGLYEMFGAFEFMYLESLDGALRDEVWERWSATVHWWLSWPGVRQWWENQPTPFTASFEAYVRGRLDTPLPDDERQRRWREFLGAPGPSRPAGSA